MAVAKACDCTCGIAFVQQGCGEGQSQIQEFQQRCERTVVIAARPGALFPHGAGLCATSCSRMFLALLDVAQLVFAVGESAVDADLLEAMIARHLELYIKVYGTDKVLPKHNYCLMLPEQLRRFGMFVKTFVHERHHMLLKKNSYHRKKAKSFELGLLEDVTVTQMQCFEQPWLIRGVQKLVQARPAMRRTLRDMHGPGEHKVARVWRTHAGNTITICT